MKTFVARCAIAAVVFVSSSPGWSQAMLPELKKQPNAQAVLDEHLDALNHCDWNRIVAQYVLDEHLDALNHCDWNRIVAQYPDDAQINLPGGTIVKGRQAIGDLFAGFCKDPKEGGLKGITFKAEQSIKIGDVFATQWVATAPFLAEHYKGSDAYITKDGYMQAMVSTFDGGALKMKK